MRRQVAAFVAVVAVGLVTVVSASTHDTNRGVARFREETIAHTALGEFAGATETWRTRVLLLRKDQAVGVGLVACIRADVHSSLRECQGTYILPRGRIQVAGEVIIRSAFQFVVVGGTGIYADTGGVLIVHDSLLTFYLQ